MAFIGRQSGQLGNYIRCNTITPDGSTTTFALTNVLDSAAVAPGSENNVICSVSGVIQAPGSAFSINNTSIVFSAAPTATDVVDFVLVLGQTIDIGTPSDNTVTMAKINGTIPNSKLDTIANSKLANSSITINGAAVALGGSTTITTIARPTITTSSALIAPSTNASFTLAGTNFVF